MNLIVGLGNPGRSYANNRHNVGFTCINYFAKTQGIRFDKKRGQARIGLGEVSGGSIVVARPQTYMNLSGRSVSRLVEKFSVSPANLIVIHDDLDLPLGKIRIRQGGSSGGHNGVDSIITLLGSRDFIRLKVGIGRPAEASEADIVAYVLSNFTTGEKQTITQVVPRVGEAILCLLTEGLVVAMNKCN